MVLRNKKCMNVGHSSFVFVFFLFFFVCVWVCMYSFFYFVFAIFSNSTHKLKNKKKRQGFDGQMMDGWLRFRVLDLTDVMGGYKEMTEHATNAFCPCSGARLFFERSQYFNYIDHLLYLDIDVIFINSFDYIINVWNYLFSHENKDTFIYGFTSEQVYPTGWYDNFYVKFPKHCKYIEPFGINSGVLFWNLKRARLSLFYFILFCVLCFVFHCSQIGTWHIFFSSELFYEAAFLTLFWEHYYFYLFFFLPVLLCMVSLCKKN